ncbi:DNA replication licensing factor MCM7, partial [Linderina macrospora]
MAELSVSESSVKYMEMLQAVADRKEDTVTIGLDDVRAYENAAVGGHTAFTHDKSLAFRIEHNAKTYVELFSRAIDQLMPESTTAAMEDPDADVLDVIYQARRQRDQRDQAARRQQGDNDAATGESFPAKLTRRYTVVFAARAKQAVQAVRGVGASQIGHLVTVRGIVTRVSDVRPAMSVAAY